MRKTANNEKYFFLIIINTLKLAFIMITIVNNKYNSKIFNCLIFEFIICFFIFEIYLKK